MKPSSDYFNPATWMLEEAKKDNIKIVDIVDRGSVTSAGIKEKVESILQPCRKHGITLNPFKFKISRTIKVGGFKIKSDDEESTPQIRPTKMAVN